MHSDIMAFSAAEFYEGTLQADDTVRQHLLRDLPGVTANTLTETAVVFIDTAGASYDEEPEPDGTSRLNRQEATLIAQKVADLLQGGIAPGDIGIITPYSAQVQLLRSQLDEAIEIFSVDGFQGREKEVILISLVRANERGEVGFLAETRRMNVALTRARRKLIVVGDSATITTHPFFDRLVAHWEASGAYRSVWEEMY
jgi:superfamily I DNA and/or RNA helicase